MLFCAFEAGQCAGRRTLLPRDCCALREAGDVQLYEYVLYEF